MHRYDFMAWYLVKHRDNHLLPGLHLDFDVYSPVKCFYFKSVLVAETKRLKTLIYVSALFTVRRTGLGAEVAQSV
jgi:hypothetical protein